MNNEKVIKKFLEKEQAQTQLRDIVNGYYTYKGRTLYTIDNKLVNYNTIIAYIDNNTLYINTKKYSSTTSRIQSKLKYLASLTSYDIVEYQE